ncbi:MAG: type II secretion system protein GspC [Idiomarina sp.]
MNWSGATTDSATLQRRLLNAGVVVLALVAVWLLAQWVWLLATPATPSAPAGTAAPSSQESSAPSVNISSLTNLHLFGESSAQSVQAQALNAPKTQLNVRLVGVSASNHPDRSAAIIQQGANQETYIVGDTLTNARVTITEIYADRVILDNSGRIETLELEGIGELSEGLSLTMANSVSNNTRSNTNTSNAASSNTREVDNRDDAELSEQLAAVASEPSNLFSYVNISPMQHDGELLGYRLSPGQQPELFRAAGFQAGDLAISINGYDLTDISSAMSATEELRTSSEVSITVLRNEEYIELVFSLPAAQE